MGFGLRNLGNVLSPGYSGPASKTNPGRCLRVMAVGVVSVRVGELE